MSSKFYKETKSRFLWLQDLQEPFNREAIEAIRQAKGDKATEHLEAEITGNNPINVFIASIFFHQTKAGKDHWIAVCKMLESKQAPKYT